MRVLLINTYYAPEIYGGAEISVKKLAEELQRQGHVVKVLCTGKTNTQDLIDGIEVIRIKSKNLCRGCESEKYPLYKRIIRRTLDIWNPFNKKAINKVIVDFKPDVVHTNGLYDLSTIVWKVAYKQNVRIVHTLRDYHLMCPFTSLSCEAVGTQCPEKPPKMFCKIHRLINKQKTKYVDVVTAPSKVTLDCLLNNGFFKSSEKAVIQNATEYEPDVVNEILNKRKNKSNQKVRFVFLGTLSEKKGIRWMISSFKKSNENAEFYIAGKGKLQEYVMSEEKQNDRIHFVGFLNEEEIDELLNKCDVLLCLSQWQEPFGRVVLDAYKHAMPVICSDQGALPTLVDNNKTGLVVESGNETELINALNHYINVNKDIYNHAALGVDKLKMYTLENQTKLFLSVYEKN